MPNNYQFHPRGIIKWHAFAALISGEEQKKEAWEEETITVDLLADKQESLNIIINEALKFNYLLEINYLENNKIKCLESYLLKIDYHCKTLIFKDITLSTYQIIDLKILD